MTAAPKDPAEPTATEADEERLHPILTNSEVLAARADAKTKVLKAQKDAAKKALIEAETQRLMIEEGLVTGDGAKDEMVTIALDLAEYTDRITINGVPYYHGHTYTVPRHVADGLRETQARTQGHQNQIEGKGFQDLFRRPHLTMLSAIGVKNAPRPVAV